MRAERPPRGWEAGPATLGTGTHRASGSQRVREVQWRLRALGYRPGPIDGIFGVRTRAAVGWFQVKHGFRVDGRASFAVVRHLRDRTTPQRAASRPAESAGPGAPAESGTPAEPGTSAGPGAPAEPAEPATPAAPPAPVVVAAPDPGTPAWAVIGLVLLAFALGFAAVALRDRARRSGPRAIGYVRVGSGEPRLDAHASAIEARCADHGIALTALVTEDERAGHARPGLAHAVRQVEDGAADCLVIGRVDRLGPSAEELATLLDTLPERPLVVLNADPVPPRSGRWTRRVEVGGRHDG